MIKVSDVYAAGEVGLATLRRVATIDASMDLDLMIQYLEIHENQEYLVKRIRALAKGGCMSSFNSTGGDSFKVRGRGPPRLSRRDSHNSYGEGGWWL